MGRATKTELEWAYLITREEFLRRVNARVELPAEEWINIRDYLFDQIISNEAPIYETKMNFQTTFLAFFAISIDI